MINRLPEITTHIGIGKIPHWSETTPIPTNSEEVFYLEVDRLNIVLASIQEIFLDKHDVELEISYSIDVLNNKDYPAGLIILKDFIQTAKTGNIIPLPSKLGKKIIRDPLTYAEAVNPKRKSIVRPSKQSPLCCRYSISANGSHFGDIFIVPVITKRSPSQAITNRRPRHSFDTIIVTADVASNAIMKKSKNSDLEIIGFAMKAYGNTQIMQENLEDWIDLTPHI